MKHLLIWTLMLSLVSCGKPDFFKQKFTNLKAIPVTYEKEDELVLINPAKEDSLISGSFSDLISYNREALNFSDIQESANTSIPTVPSFHEKQGMVAENMQEPDTLELMLLKASDQQLPVILITEYDEYLLSDVHYDPTTQTFTGHSVKLNRKNTPENEGFIEIVAGKIEINDVGDVKIYRKDIKETRSVIESGEIDMYYADRELSFQQEYQIMNSRLQPKHHLFMATYCLSAFLVFGILGVLFNINFLILALLVYLFGIGNLMLGVKWNARNKRYERDFGALRTDKHKHIGQTLWTLLWLFGAVGAFIPVLIAWLMIRNDGGK